MTTTTKGNGSPGRVSFDRLVHDLQIVMEDADALLRATAGQAGEKVEQARARAEESLKLAREHMANIEKEVTRRTQEAVQSTDQYVRANPWQSLGIAAGVAFLIGVLLSRR